MVSHPNITANKDTNFDTSILLDLVRGATTVFTTGTRTDAGGNDDTDLVGMSFNYLDSPNTTSATTYKTQGYMDASYGDDIRFQVNNNSSSIILMEIRA